jgi:hypothetical protein
MNYHDLKLHSKTLFLCIVQVSPTTLSVVSKTKDVYALAEHLVQKGIGIVGWI